MVIDTAHSSGVGSMYGQTWMKLTCILHSFQGSEGKRKPSVDMMERNGVDLHRPGDLELRPGLVRRRLMVRQPEDQLAAPHWNISGSKHCDVFVKYVFHTNFSLGSRCSWSIFKLKRSFVF